MTKLSKKFPKAARMPEVPKSVVIGKCITCGLFRRLKDLDGVVCGPAFADYCAEQVAYLLKYAEQEREKAKKLKASTDYQKLAACDSCERFYPESELQGGTCRECQELPL